MGNQQISSDTNSTDSAPQHQFNRHLVFSTSIHSPRDSSQSPSYRRQTRLNQTKDQKPISHASLRSKPRRNPDRLPKSRPRQRFDPTPQHALLNPTHVRKRAIHRHLIPQRNRRLLRRRPRANSLPHLSTRPDWAFAKDVRV